MNYFAYLKFLTILPSRPSIVTHRAKSVHDIDFDKLKKEGAQLVMFDMDETLTYHLGPLDEKTGNLLNSLKEKGFKLGIFSNSRKKRTEELNQIFGRLEIYNVSRSDKPSPGGFLEILSHYTIPATRAVMVGDKIGNDLYGAKLAGVKTRILVEPYSEIYGGKSAKFLDRFIRSFEKEVYF